MSFIFLLVMINTVQLLSIWYALLKGHFLDLAHSINTPLTK